jgi:tight adherence protein C
MLDAITAMLTERLGPLGPLMVIGFLGVVLIAIALPTMMKRQPDRFRDLKAQRSEQEGAKAKGLRKADKVDKLEKFAQFLEPKSAEELSASRMKMLRAGYPGKNAVRMFHASQFVLGISFLVVGVIVAMTKAAQAEVDPSTQQMILYTVVPGAIGYYLPQYWVQRRVQQRTEQIVQGFPDALDMMLVCVEAGQSLDQSILRVAKETRVGYPALADEFDMVANEVKAGKERVAVLKDMSERVGIADVSSFVTTLVQSATFGTSIAEALRVYSAEMRDKRVMRAEEKANVLPTKLTLGTMMFTVPPLMIILIGPSVYGISQMLGNGG